MCIAHALQHYAHCSTEYDAPTVSELPSPPFAPPSPLRSLPPPPPLLIYVAARRAAAVTRSFCRDMTQKSRRGVKKKVYRGRLSGGNSHGRLRTGGRMCRKDSNYSRLASQHYISPPHINSHTTVGLSRTPPDSVLVLPTHFSGEALLPGMLASAPLRTSSAECRAGQWYVRPRSRPAPTRAPGGYCVRPLPEAVLRVFRLRPVLLRLQLSGLPQQPRERRDAQACYRADTRAQPLGVPTQDQPLGARRREHRLAGPPQQGLSLQEVGLPQEVLRVLPGAPPLGPHV